MGRWLSRRSILVAGVAIAGDLASGSRAMPVQPSTSSPSDGAVGEPEKGGQAMKASRLSLRLLATSDLHMFVFAYDYYRAQMDGAVGLARVASLIRAARVEAVNTLLVDNGDILQGNPLGDYLALPGHLPAHSGHPMFRAMNRLGYDVATLGNHEFNYGLPFLAEALRSADFPFVCANADRADGTPLVPRNVVLERDFTDRDGTAHRLRIGVIGFLPPQIVRWDAMHLAGRVQTTDIVAAARRFVPDLRARCDLVVALCHAGISAERHVEGGENAALHLAEVPGVDVVVTGHAHRVFPGPDYAGLPGVDAARGTLAGKPAVMPGFWGSHLGVIDLELEPGDTGWRIASFATEVRPISVRQHGVVRPLAADDALCCAVAEPAHEATIAWMAQPVGTTRLPINTYFAFLGADPSLALVNEAQLWYARPLLAQSDAASLPLLSAAAPFNAGGMTPDAFVDIPAGPLSMRNLANIYSFANTVAVVRCTGAEVREWLERAAIIFSQVIPGLETPQPLLAADRPSYNFDVIAGLTYTIDITQPPRYHPDGTLANSQARRINDMRFEGKPVAEDLNFAVITNNYRAGGGGHFPGTGEGHEILTAPDGNRDVLIRFVQERKEVQPSLDPVWTFEKVSAPFTVFVDLPPAAEAAAVRRGLLDLGTGENGRRRYGMRVA